MVRSRHVLLTLAALALVSGCTAILGDFEVGAGDGTGSDAGNDGGGGGGGPDAFADGPSPGKDATGVNDGAQPTDGQLVDSSGGNKCDGGLTRCGAQCLDTDGDSANCGACGRSCGGGTCTSGACSVATVVKDIDTPAQLAEGGFFVYFASADHTIINQCSKTGCAKPNALIAAASIALDGDVQSLGATTTSIYFPGHYTNTTTGAQYIFSCASSGCNNSPGWFSSVVQGTGITAFTMDAVNMYWTGTYGSAYRIALTGAGQKATMVTSHQEGLSQLGGDGTTLVWTNNFSNYAMASAATNDCTTSPSTTCKETSLWAPTGFTIGQVRVLGPTAYIVATDQAAKTVGIYTCNIAGCNNTPTPFVTGEAAIDAIALDASGIYWVVASAGAVRACRGSTPCGTKAETLATITQPPRAIVLDKDFVYFTSVGAGAGSSAVLRIAK